VEVEGFPEYVVESILSHRLQTRGRGRPVTMFLVKWKDFGPEHNTWEPEAHLTANGKYTNSKLTEYWRSLAQPPSTGDATQAPTGRARMMSTRKLKRKASLLPQPVVTRNTRKKL
jgi:hypothetical protein